MGPLILTGTFDSLHTDTVWVFERAPARRRRSERAPENSHFRYFDLFFQGPSTTSLFTAVIPRLGKLARFLNYTLILVLHLLKKLESSRGLNRAPP